MGLSRDGKITAFDPLKVFEAAEISQAFRHFSGKNRMGKIAISFEDDASMVKVRHFPALAPLFIHPTLPYRSSPPTTAASSLPQRPTSYPAASAASVAALPNG